MLLTGFILLSAWLAVLVYHDCRHRRLPNALTLGGALVVLAWRFGCGMASFMDGVWGGVVCGLFLLLPFILHAAGGGDVKMLFAVGCVMGIGRTAETILFTSLAGLLLMLVMLIWCNADSRRLRHFFRSAFDWRYNRADGAKSLPPKSDEKCRVPFGVAIAAGTWLALLYSISL